MIYGYARVSSIGQEMYGTSLDGQIETLTENGCHEVFSEAYTGTTTERPEFEKLLKKLKKGDTLMVTKLDRLSRSAGKGISLVEDLMKQGIKVHILNMGLVEDTPTGHLIMNVMLSFAQFERDMIFERTQAGKVRARAEGRKAEGRNKKVPENFAEFRRQVESNKMSITQACKEMHISRGTYYKIIEENRV